MGLNWYDYGARMYDPAVGRFFTQDRFAEKYFPMTPYQYAANNPIKYIDVNGDSINIAGLLVGDISASVNLLLDLSEQTGLNLSVDSRGNIGYSKNSETGEAIVAEVDGVQQGSETGRNNLISAINNEGTVSVFSSKGYGSVAQRNNIYLDGDQIDAFIDGTSNDLNPKTLGYGLTFLHELSHTEVGGNLRDPEESGTGATVDRINRIRNELDSNPYGSIFSNGPYGSRTQYRAKPGRGSEYIIPFKTPNNQNTNVTFTYQPRRRGRKIVSYATQ